MVTSRLKSWITGILTWLLLFIVAYPVSLVGSWGALAVIGFYETKREVTGRAPNLFPILVMTPQLSSSTPKAQIVYQRDLEDFLAKNPQYSYLVPPGMEANFQSQLMQQSSMYKNPPDYTAPPWTASFNVERLPNGHQLLEVYAPPWEDMRDTGWYEATDKEIFPRYDKVYSDLDLVFGATILAGPIAVVPNILLATLAFWVLRRARRAKAKPSESATGPGPQPPSQ